MNEEEKDDLIKELQEQIVTLETVQHDLEAHIREIDAAANALYKMI